MAARLPVSDHSKSEVKTMPHHTLEQPRHAFSTGPSFSSDHSTYSSAQSRPLSGTPGNEEKNGKVIVQNDQIFITPPLPGGKAAVISALHPVVLKINRIKVNEPAAITSSVQLSWEISEKPQYQITVSEDGLSAYFTLYRVEKYAWKLVNCPASAQVCVRAEPNYDLLLSRLTVNQILADFSSSSFMPNLNIPALYAELNNPTYLPVCIAVGKPPLPGIDGRLELPARLPGTDDDVPDYPEIPSARTGGILARKLPPQEGRPGFNVHGSILPPPRPEDITLKPADCYSLLPGGEIVALRDGRPRITGWGTRTMSIDFPETHIIQESMTSADSPVLFAGDVIAPDGIADHCTIEVLGNVYISGDVRHAVIAATGSVVIRGKVTDSHIYCGDCGAIQHRLHQFPSQLMEELMLLRNAALMLEENLRSRQQPVKYGLVVLLLLEGKYAHLPGLMKGLQELLAGNGPAAPVDTRQLKHMLEIFLHPGQFTEFINDAVLVTFLDLLEELRDGVLHMHEGNVRLDLAQAENCLLRSGGSIFIHGEGVLHSTLLAAGDVRFLMTQSLCSGSKVEAGDSISVQQTRAADRQTALTAGHQISVCQIEGTRISIGEYAAEFTAPAGEAVFTAQSLRLRNQT
ncbi:flagellar assembly protein A [Paenibacillus sp. FSL R7-0345]|uniref:flagellar assembly protein A n=1 Tax=Paenibacillus sp. FSL R7-0345 TaxID=2954535 RepID=UPI003159A757